MRNAAAFVNGIVFTLAVLIAAALVAIFQGLVSAGADTKPSNFERWAANKSLHAQIRRQSTAYSDPLEATTENLTAGVHLYAGNCAVCHGTSDGRPSRLAQGFYIKAPQFAKDGVEDDPENVTYWKLLHGIRFSAMPAFEKTLSSDDLWRITLFLKQMDRLPPDVAAEWKKLPSAAPSPAPT